MIFDLCLQLLCRAAKLPWIFLGAPLNFNGAPGNIQGNMLYLILFRIDNFTNPRMHLFHIPQCSTQNRNVHISVLNGAWWNMEQVHSGICELRQLAMLYQDHIILPIIPQLLRHHCYTAFINISHLDNLTLGSLFAACRGQILFWWTERISIMETNCPHYSQTDWAHKH